VLFKTPSLDHDLPFVCILAVSLPPPLSLSFSLSVCLFVARDFGIDIGSVWNPETLRNAFHKRLRVHSVVQSWIKRDWIRANKPAVSWPSLALISERASLPRLGHYLSMIHLLIPIDSGNTREARTKISRCSKYFDISQLVHAI